MRNLSILKQFFLFSFLVSAPVIYAQNVGVNTSGSTPSVNAILDLNTGNTGRNMGLIIPHVALTTTLTQFSPPIVSAASILDTGMIVYNTNIAAGSGVGYYYWNGNTWVSVASAVGGGLTSANNGLSVNGTIVQLGGLTTAPAPLLQNSVISGSNFNLDFDLGTYTSTGTGSFLITNGGTANTYLSVTSTTPGVGVNINPALSTLDVNGSIATRAKSLSITANTVIATANTSYIVMTSNSTQCSSPYNILSLSNGQPGQELVLEVSSGYASLPNSGNVALAAAVVFTPYSTLFLKWDNINSVWVELARNALTLSSAPSLVSSFSWNGTTTYYTGSVQTWTVPSCATTITVTAVGGSGFSTSLGGAGGLGASLTGTVTVVPGHILDILVGGQGTDNTPGSFGASGGGGTYIWDATTSTLLVVAGGGGGAGAVSGPGNNGQTSRVSAAALQTATGTANNGAGGVGGGPGTIGTGGTTKGGAGGAGWSTSFTTAFWANSTAYCPTCAPTPGQGGAGSSASDGFGGYGGGGGGAFNAGGGGGGYNGGGGGNGNGGFVGWGGGGGGSYWQGTVPTSSTTGSAASNGSVTITY